MGRLIVTNSDELSDFFESLLPSHSAEPIKGPAPKGATYSDGEPIVLPINIAWRCVETGEQVHIKYEVTQ